MRFPTLAVVPALVLFFCLCGDAYGETVDIGGKSIPYQAPAGFSRADGLFNIHLKELDKEFGMDTVIFATFIPAMDLDARGRDTRYVPSWYAQLAYDRIFTRLGIGEAGFIVVTELVESVIGKQYANPAFREKLGAVIEGALNRKLVVQAMTHKGFVEKKPGYRSMLAYGHGEMEGETGMEPVNLATMTTFFVSGGKLITIIQACRVASDQALPAFTEKALRIAAEISGRNPE